MGNNGEWHHHGDQRMHHSHDGGDQPHTHLPGGYSFEGERAADDHPSDAGRTERA